jgi:hypothetical protein
MKREKILKILNLVYQTVVTILTTWCTTCMILSVKPYFLTLTA